MDRRPKQTVHTYTNRSPHGQYTLAIWGIHPLGWIQFKRLTLPSIDKNVEQFALSCFLESYLNLCITHVSVHMLRLFLHVWLFTTPWTAAHQAPLSKGFSRQEHWSGLPCPSPNLWLYSRVFIQQQKLHIYIGKMYNKLQSSIICIISQLKTTQMPINRMDTKIMV